VAHLQSRHFVANSRAGGAVARFLIVFAVVWPLAGGRAPAQEPLPIDDVHASVYSLAVGIGRARVHTRRRDHVVN
jgi:hypothetical protein